MLASVFGADKSKNERRNNGNHVQERAEGHVADDDTVKNGADNGLVGNLHSQLVGSRSDNKTLQSGVMCNEIKHGFGADMLALRFHKVLRSIDRRNANHAEHKE